MSRPAQRNFQQQSSVAQDFFSQQNRSRLTDIIVSDVQNRQQLNQKQLERLNKTVDHYMREVYQYEGEKPLTYLNKAVVGATATDFGRYIQRQETIRQQTQTPEQTVMTQPNPLQTPSLQTYQGLLTNSPSENTVQIPQEQGIFQDVSRRYEMLQQQRNDVKVQPPPVPEFRVPPDQNQPAALSLFEQARKSREQEAAEVSAQAAAKQPQSQSQSQSQPPQRSLAQYQERLQPLPSQSFQVQQQPLQIQEPFNNPALPIRPDGREIYQTSITTAAELQMPQSEGGSGITPIQTRGYLGLAEANPTVAAPQAAILQIPFQPQSSGQNIVTRNEPDMTYRENEQNLVIYSYDRNWLVNTTENRYNFTVNFDAGNLSTSQYHYNTSIQKRLKNIVRLELIKAIIPVESLENLVLSDASATSSNLFGSVDTSYQLSALTYPYVIVNLQEYDGNNYGTDNFQDRSFGTIHYERTWQSDTNYSSQPYTTNQPRYCQDSKGFVLMVPRYLDCQRVFTPTPLSTLQRLTINLQNPLGNTLSLLPDTFDISGFYANTSTDFPSGGAIYPNSAYSSAAGLSSTQMGFIFIQTTKYFPRSAVNVGDRIMVGGIGYNSIALTTNPGLGDFSNWINEDTGHVVCNIGYVNTTTGAYSDGYNQLGYSNIIIIDGRYSDPTTGSVGTQPFTGTSGSALTGTTLEGNNANLVTTPKRIINLNRQTNLVFRVITREKDGAGHIRTDNLF